MELQDLSHVYIKTFDPVSSVVKVTVAVGKERSCMCEEILQKAGDILGLKRESLSSFTICDGHSQPLKRYRKDEFISVDAKDLSFQKWCFDLRQENDLIHKDPAATSLIFFQAQHQVKTGQLSPNAEEAVKLDDCLDPDFPADGQYIKLCQSLPDYKSVLIQGCRICEENNMDHASQLPPLSQVDVVMSRFGLRCFSDNHSYKFTWFDVTMWTINQEKKTLVFAIKKQDSDACCLPLHSEQISYMYSVMSEMLLLLQKQDKDCEVTFHTDMMQTLEDGSTQWTNGFYFPDKATKVKDSL